MSQSGQQEQREEHQDGRSPGQTGGKRYRLHQKMVSIGNDYWIENEAGEQVYKVDGKAMRLNKTFYLEDAHGNKLAKIKKHLLTLKQTMEITAPDGEQLGVVKKALFTPLKEHFQVDIKYGPDLEVHGDILDHEYSISAGHDKVAEISKKYFNLRDSYSVSIEADQNDVIILSVVVCIDEMTHPGS